MLSGERKFLINGQQCTEPKYTQKKMGSETDTEKRVTWIEMKRWAPYLAPLFWTIGFCLCTVCCISVIALIIASLGYSTSNTNNNDIDTLTSTKCPCSSGMFVVQPTFEENILTSSANKAALVSEKAQKPIRTHLNRRATAVLRENNKKQVASVGSVLGGPMTVIYQKSGREVTFTILTVNYTSSVGVYEIDVPFSQFPVSILPLSNTVAYEPDYQFWQYSQSATDYWFNFFELTSDISTSKLVIYNDEGGSGPNFTSPSLSFTYLTAATSSAIKYGATVVSLLMAMTFF